MEGKKLKEFFVREGVSLSEVARRLGVSQQNLSSLLSSDNIKTGTLEKVAEILGKSPAYFYTGENSGTAVVGTANQSTVIGKQESLTAVRVLERQLEIKDAQIDKLIDIIRTQK